MSYDYGSVNAYGINIDKITAKGLYNLVEEIEKEKSFNKLKTENGASRFDEIKKALKNPKSKKNENFIEDYESDNYIYALPGILDDIITYSKKYNIFFIERDYDTEEYFLLYQSPMFKTDESEYFTQKQIDNKFKAITKTLKIDEIPDYQSLHWYG